VIFVFARRRSGVRILSAPLEKLGNLQNKDKQACTISQGRSFYVQQL
jgi:hypothetical protein